MRNWTADGLARTVPVTQALVGNNRRTECTDRPVIAILVFAPLRVSQWTRLAAVGGVFNEVTPPSVPRS